MYRCELAIAMILCCRIFTADCLHLSDTESYYFLALPQLMIDTFWSDKN